MLKKIILLGLFSVSFWSNAQTDTSGRSLYRAEHTKSTELEHTKLRVSFNLPEKELYGEEWLTASPYFYPSDSIVLDAKSMLIHSVKMIDKNKENPLQYTYKDNILRINLGKTYKKGEKYTIYIKYTAQPEKVTQSGGSAISDAKGLYFINPTGEEANVPTQIWTQGETESSSCWFPTIDKPNQKTTQEIYIRVPERFVTLSNGVLKSSKKDKSGQRTDHWVMDKKHAPYLFFLGAGDYSVIKDKPWRGKVSVDYYVEKEYANVAKQIFGKTSEMMEYYSKLLKYDFPWQKYAQITAREYVSGAMENTTAVIHGDGIQQTAEQLVDENTWEATIAHELFHHWFGDLVTAESWANLTVNESFANYSESLWFWHKYGADYGDFHLSQDVGEYKHSNSFRKHLVRFNYADREEMFDRVSYNKGGAILHMLRDYLGDEAFFEGISLYLKENEYGTGEAQKVRLALEKISGKDLNWFFNQWFYNYGHILISPNVSYDEAKKEAMVKIAQSDSLPFQFPLEIDLYAGGKYERKRVWVDAKAENTFRFSLPSKYNLVNIDPRGVLLSDENEYKTAEEYLFQYKNAKDFKSRNQAIDYAIKAKNYEILKLALNDPFFRLRVKVLENLDQESLALFLPMVEKIAVSDPENLVKAAATTLLSYLIDPKYKPIFEKGIVSGSNSIKIASVVGLLAYDPTKVTEYIDQINLNQLNFDQMSLFLPYIIHTKNEKYLEPIIQYVTFYPLMQNQNEREFLKKGYIWLMETDNTSLVKKTIPILKQINEYFIKPETKNAFKEMIQEGISIKEELYRQNPNSNSLKEQIKLLKELSF
ncbi:MAG: M1 family metallopeptidase [Capnocytophaga sp.]|nr:M1 family metallopeptidase [Capnocytophaga sp.]